MKYTTPIICDRNRNLEKDWYVEFYFKEKRYQIKSGNKYGIKGTPRKIKLRKQRQIYFQQLQQVIHTRLKEGWNPTGQAEINTISDALLFAVSQKKMMTEMLTKEYVKDTPAR